MMEMYFLLVKKSPVRFQQGCPKMNKNLPVESFMVSLLGGNLTKGTTALKLPRGQRLGGQIVVEVTDFFGRLFRRKIWVKN